MGIRLTLTEARAAQLSTEISRMLNGALRDRTGLEEKWTKNDEQYYGDVQPSDFPWPGASAYFVPLSETYTNAVSARLVDAMHAYDPIFTVRNRTAEWVDTARAAQDFIQYLMTEVVKLRRANEKAMLSMAKHGTAFYFSPWEVQLEQRPVYDPAADDINLEVITKVANPVLIVPSIRDVLVPKEAASMALAPWRAYRVMLTEDELRMRAFSGLYPEASIKKIIDTPQTQPDELTRRAKEQEGFSVSNYEPFYEIWNWWGLFHVAGMKHPGKFIVPFHLPTNTPLSLILNFYPRQFDPFFAANFQVTDGGVYGRGICEMVRSGNREVNDLHKHRVDNAMVANTRFWKVKSSLQAVLARNFRIWPGRRVPVSSMDDIQGEAMADIYGSTLNEEMLVRRTMEQQVGLVDFSLTGGGGESLKRVGATAALTAVQESGRVLNARLNHVREVMADIARWLLEMYGHFRPISEIRQVVGDKGLMALNKLFDAPSAMSVGHISIELSASSAAVNREIDKQSDIVLVNIMSTYFQRYFELATMLANPQLPPPLRQLATSIGSAANQLMTDVLRDFNKRNSALVLAELSDLFSSGQEIPQESINGQLVTAAVRRQGLPTNIPRSEASVGQTA